MCTQHLENQSFLYLSSFPLRFSQDFEVIQVINNKQHFHVAVPSIKFTLEISEMFI